MDKRVKIKLNSHNALYKKIFRSKNKLLIYIIFYNIKYNNSHADRSVK